MKFKFKPDEQQFTEIELEISFWLGKITVKVNGIEAERLKEKGKPFKIQRIDGTSGKMFVKGNGFDPIPKVIIDGKTVLLARKLLWYELIFGGLPMVLIFGGGAIGGFFGAMGTFYNYKTLRNDLSAVVKFIYVIGITLLAFIFYMMLAVIFQTMIGKI